MRWHKKKKERKEKRLEMEMMIHGGRERGGGNGDDMSLYELLTVFNHGECRLGLGFFQVTKKANGTLETVQSTCGDECRRCDGPKSW
jgi:hypothetical protein